MSIEFWAKKNRRLLKTTCDETETKFENQFRIFFAITSF